MAHAIQNLPLPKLHSVSEAKDDGLDMSRFKGHLHVRSHALRFAQLSRGTLSVSNMHNLPQLDNVVDFLGCSQRVPALRLHHSIRNPSVPADGYSLSLKLLQNWPLALQPVPAGFHLSSQQRQEV
jgi:hypothetical protein